MYLNAKGECIFNAGNRTYISDQLRRGKEGAAFWYSLPGKYITYLVLENVLHLCIHVSASHTSFNSLTTVDY